MRPPRKASPPRPQSRARPAGPAPWLFAALLLAAAGCSPRRVPVPDVSPEAAGRQALEAYDANKDGVLDAKELERCPALKNNLKALDADGDGRLSAREVAARVAAFRDGKVGLVSLPCQVLADGKPLAGAAVTLVPEKFLGPALRPASGVSDARGMVQLRIEGADLPGVACGFYRVEVSRKEGGRERVPARYNTQTVLGQEVAPDTLGRHGPVVFRLTGL